MAGESSAGSSRGPDLQRTSSRPCLRNSATIGIESSFRVVAEASGNHAGAVAYGVRDHLQPRIIHARYRSGNADRRGNLAAPVKDRGAGAARPGLRLFVVHGVALPHHFVELLSETRKARNGALRNALEAQRVQLGIAFFSRRKSQDSFA